MPRPGDKAWIALGVGVLTYEALCPDDELMSHAAERWMRHHPWLVRGASFFLAAHVCSTIPSVCDPLHWLFKAKRFVKPPVSLRAKHTV